MLTQSERGNDFVQCATNLFNDESQLTGKANSGLSRSKSEFTFRGSRAAEKRIDLVSSNDDGGVDNGNVRFVDGIDNRVILGRSVGLQSRGGSV